MEVCCDLEVDVNGEETFMVDKKIISLYSWRLRKLFGKSAASTGNLKVIFNDFPGGPESFELFSRFCYNNGRINITPSNVSLLHSSAHFMEMDNSIFGNQNLIEQIEKPLQDISYWRWSDLILILKQCQSLLPFVGSSNIVEKCIDSLIGRMASSSESSPCPSTSSPDSSGVRFSFNTRGTESLKNSFLRAMWWFEDLSVLSTDMIEMVVKTAASRKFDHVVISKFLFYYQKTYSSTAPTDEMRRIVETVINLLHILDRNTVSCRSLFGILRVASSLSTTKIIKNKLETMIGSQMDQANIDNLLIPSPCGVNYSYDVNLVLRLLKAFLHQEVSHSSTERLRKVADLTDLYLAEVAPDPCLKPSKFLALAMALPDSARDSYDKIYRALDMYLEVHSGFSEDEKIKICYTLNYEKLSAGACKHLTQNKRFPSKNRVQALISQQVKFKSLLHDIDSPTCSSDSPCSLSEDSLIDMKHEANKQIVHYAGTLDIPTDGKKLREHLQGIQCRVMELEKACGKMQMQMTKIMKLRASSHSSARALPKLCS